MHVNVFHLDYRGSDNIDDDKQEDLSTSMEAVGGNGFLRDGNDGAGREQVPVVGSAGCGHVPAVGSEQVPVVNDESSGVWQLTMGVLQQQWRRREMGWLMFSMTRFSPSGL